MACKRCGVRHGGMINCKPADVVAYKAAQAARRPLPPDVLVGALHDTVHREVGKYRPAASNKTNIASNAVEDASNEKKQRWSKDKYNAYQREYMKKHRAKAKAA